MKKTILITLLSVIALYTKGQILKIATTPSAIIAQIPGYSQVSAISTKTYPYTPSTPSTQPTPIDEDSTTEDDRIYDYADVLPVNITIPDGNITSTSVGKVWTLRISIPNALNIGFIFNQFNLSANAEMYIFNESRNVLDSSIKKEHFTNSSTVTVSSITGNAIIIYIIEPNNTGIFQSSISINKLLAGYQSISEVGEAGTNQLARASINCNPMVQCQQDKIPYARAVARMVTEVTPGRFGFCTGTLINNETNNGRAYFLTAFHCIDRNKNKVIDQQEIDLLAITDFQFQFWRTVCNGTVNNRTLDFTGAILRASSPNTDVVLLELTNPPGIGDLINYAGWNRQTESPTDNNSFIMHHPQTQDMRITSTQNVKSWFWNSNYWSAHYYSGTVDKGSSGSALMNPGGQIVGQLRGGWSNCNYTDFGDRYGKFDRSWGGAGLQTWLSPIQGLQSTALLNLTDIPINGPGTIACTTPAQFSTLPNLLDVTYQWTVTTGLQIVSGQGTSTVTISGFPNNNVGSGFLTLTLRSPTKGRTRIYTATKQVFISNGSVLGTYNSPTNSTQPLAPFTRFNQVTNNTCISVATNMTIPAGSTVTWSGPANTSEIMWGQSGNNVNIYFSALNQEIVLSLSVTNSCGTRNFNYRFTRTSTNSCGIAPLRVALSPNPSSNNIQISLTEKANANLKMDIAEIRIIDKSGSIKLRNTYGAGQKILNLNISTLTPDVYTILVFDKQTWTSEKFIKN